MTVEIIVYSTKDSMINGKKLMHKKSFVALHTDFIDTKKARNYKVTFVNGLDDPSNRPQPPLKQLTQREFIEFLAGKFDIDLI